MKFSSAVAAAWMLATVIAAEPASAGADKGRSALVESVLASVEAASQQPFDGAVRRFLEQVLSRYSAEDLESMRREGRLTVGAADLGESQAELVYTPVTPCRIIDTRSAGGSLPPWNGGDPTAFIRDFRVVGTGLQGQGGNPSGCGVIAAATAAVINFVAVDAAGLGDFRVWSYSTPVVGPPAASVVNYALPGSGLNVANAVTVPICNRFLPGNPCDFDIRVMAEGSSVHLVADVVGFYNRVSKESVKSFTVTNSVANPTTISTACSNLGNGQVTINAPVAGRVVVLARETGVTLHTLGCDNSWTWGIAQSPVDCNNNENTFVYAGSLPTGNPGRTTMTFGSFDVPPGPHTFYLTGSASNACGVGTVVSVRMQATFYPN
jgi:hypothetical protein